MQLVPDHVADRDFKRLKTAVHPFQRPSVLVTGGTFRLRRNPMHLGMLLVLAGVGLALGSATPFLVIPAFWWWIWRAVVRHEGRTLTREFGSVDEEYAARVRRWL